MITKAQIRTNRLALRNAIATDTFPFSMASSACCVLPRLRYIFGDKNDDQFAQLLGLTRHQYDEVVIPSGWNVVERYPRGKVVAMLDHLIDSGQIKWSTDPFDIVHTKRLDEVAEELFTNEQFKAAIIAAQTEGSKMWLWISRNVPKQWQWPVYALALDDCAETSLWLEGK